MPFKTLFVRGSFVAEIPASKIKSNIEFPTLSNQNGIRVTFIYETQNRRPYLIYRINFSRIKFNNEGVYDAEQYLLSEEFRVAGEQLYSSLDFSSYPLSVPIAPCIPNKEELKSIKTYLNKKYPILLENTPYAFEITIAGLQELHKQQIQVMKKSHKSS